MEAFRAGEDLGETPVPCPQDEKTRAQTDDVSHPSAHGMFPWPSSLQATLPQNPREGAVWESTSAGARHTVGAQCGHECPRACGGGPRSTHAMTWVLMGRRGKEPLSHLLTAATKHTASSYRLACSMAQTGSLLDTGACSALQWDWSLSKQLEQMATLKSYFATG